MVKLTFLPEGHEQIGKLARLCRSMYGTHDAASISVDTWSDALKESVEREFHESRNRVPIFLLQL